MAFLLDSLIERIGNGEEENELKDLNYIIGNTSGLDIGQVPSPLDQRIGRMAQIGGGIMEIEIDNPATFQIDRPELMNVINQLGYNDITLHGDPNIGFTGAYATRGQAVQGYNIVHRYFRRYLEQMASFKWETEQDPNIEFDVGYVNMHASNEQIPPREEQIASDKSLDPFGMRLTEINGKKEPNIYRNNDFMELLFDFLVREYIERYEIFQLYTFFENHSTVFEKIWDKARHQRADSIYEEEDEDSRTQLATTAVATDPGRNQTFADELRSILPDDDVFEELPLSLENLQGTRQGIREVMQNQGYTAEEINEVFEQIPDIIDRIWYFENDIDGFSYEAKASALTNHLDYSARDLDEPASKYSVTQPDTGEKQDVIEWARRTLAGRDEMFEEEDYDDEDDTPPNLEIFESLINQTAVGRAMEKESTAYFHIMPAWMMTADEEYENHDGWNVPKFIWRNIVEANAPDDLDLTDYEDFQKFLDESNENELNVIAAVGACYLWGHWTQNKDDFDEKAFEQTVRKTEGYERPEVEGKYTWVEWMHKFGLRVNIEAMFGGPGELRRLWRPKDIAIACHAINKQARQDIEGWGAGDDLVKFTIDMEHTASYGVDPWQELQALIEEERRMAKEGEIDADPDKALSKIVKTYHLTKPGWEQQQGHRHGPFTRGDETLYTWLYNLVNNGFARNPKDEARIIFEVGGEYREEMYVMRVAMDMIERGIAPEKLDEILQEIPLDGEFESVEQELVARFFGIDKGNFEREWAKIEEHAFDPLDGLLEAEGFDFTWSGNAAIEGGTRPNEWKQEEYR